MTCKGHAPLPTSLSFFTSFTFLCPPLPPPQPITSWGQGEAEQTVCPLAVVPPGSEAGPAPGLPASPGRGCSWRQSGRAILERATPAEGRPKAGRWLNLPCYWTPGSRLFRPIHREPRPGIRPFGPSGWRLALPRPWLEAPRHLGGRLGLALFPTGQ